MNQMYVTGVLVYMNQMSDYCTVRKECWWYMNQMSDVLITVKRECWWYMNQMSDVLLL